MELAEADAGGQVKYRVVRTQSDDIQTMFELEDPADEYEQEFNIWFHTEAWKAQGSPEILDVEITAVES